MIEWIRSRIGILYLLIRRSWSHLPRLSQKLRANNSGTQEAFPDQMRYQVNNHLMHGRIWKKSMQIRISLVEENLKQLFQALELRRILRVRLKWQLTKQKANQWVIWIVLILRQLQSMLVRLNNCLKLMSLNPFLCNWKVKYTARRILATKMQNRCLANIEDERT